MNLKMIKSDEIQIALIEVIESNNAKQIAKMIRKDSPMASLFLLEELRTQDKEKYIQVMEELGIEPDIIEKIKVKYMMMSA